MRNLDELDAYRLPRSIYVYKSLGSYGDATCGAFFIPSPSTGSRLLVLADQREGWDHVSVSHHKRIPNWHEMELVKRTIFLPTECVVQYHVPVAEHINVHPNCLHLWRPHGIELPRPSNHLVAGHYSLSAF